MIKSSVICLLSLMCLISCENANIYPTNKIKQGTLHGKYLTTRNGQQISAFLSIPYAEPPIDNLRFKAPMTSKSWEGVLDATKPHAVCPQIDIFLRQDYVIEGDENCLYLNVYTPQLRNDEKELYSVMIFIHGGGYMCGTALAYDPEFLLDENIVLVTINYRLGVFGFFTTGDEVVPGNNGLKDQSMAIKWVHDNIKAFGGDPEKITIFGESAGGASVHMHIFSPLSKGLFNRAISQSGTAFNTWALGETKGVAEISKRLAELLECPIQDNYKMVDCLQTIDAYKIIEIDSSVHNWSISFRPVVEIHHKGAFLPEHPLDALKSGKFANVPWMAGINSEEGVIAAARKNPYAIQNPQITPSFLDIYKNPDVLREINDDFNRIILMGFESTVDNFEIISNKIRHFYFGNKRIDSSTRWNLIRMFSDMFFAVAHDAAVKSHYRYSKQPVYNYFYSHQGIDSIGRIMEDNSLRYGASHADELFLLFPFGAKLQRQELDELDKHVSNLIIQLWTNFAKTANPTPELNSIISTKWNPLESEDLEYYYIGSGVHTVKNLYSERLKFWENLNILPYTKNIKEEL